MNEEELNRLLEKYYNGESTEDEDLLLMEFFTKKDIPQGHEAEKEIFRHYKVLAEIPEPSQDFEFRILAGIDAFDHNSGSQKIRKHLLPYLSAAAGLLILAGSYFFFIQKSETEDTFKDPQIAYAETMRILMGVSSQLNHGAQTLEPVGKINEMMNKSFEVINKSTLIVEKNLKNLDYLEKANLNTDVPDSKNINK